MVLALGVTLALAGQSSDGITSAKQLSPKTRPIRHFVGLDDKDIVTVSRYTNRESPFPTYVYRYSFPGNLADTLKAFQKRLTAKDGWITEKFRPGEIALEHQWKTGPVSSTALLFHQAKLIPDEHGGHPAKGDIGLKWIWVSYNEQVRKKS